VNWFLTRGRMFIELMPLLGERTVMLIVARIDQNRIRVNVATRAGIGSGLLSSNRRTASRSTRTFGPGWYSFRSIEPVRLVRFRVALFVSWAGTHAR